MSKLKGHCSSISSLGPAFSPTLLSEKNSKFQKSFITFSLSEADVTRESFSFKVGLQETHKCISDISHRIKKEHPR